MGHNIYITSKGASFFSVQELPWHKLGKILEEPPTAREAIMHAQLDYNVSKVDLKTVTGASVPDRVATLREDTNKVLGIVSDRYSVLQNAEAFEFMDSIVGQGEAVYETAGALGIGECIFITCKLPDHLHVPNFQDDIIERYLLISNSHDGSSGVKIMFTPIRVVCNNTLLAALNSGTYLNIRHSGDIYEKLEHARVTLNIVNSLTEELQEINNRLINRPIRDGKLDEYFGGLVIKDTEKFQKFMEDRNSPEVSTRYKNIVSDLKTYYFAGPGQEAVLGTCFGASQAVSGYLQNVKKFSSEEAKIKHVSFRNKNDILERSVANLLTHDYWN